jgi:hypothetical protein
MVLEVEGGAFALPGEAGAYTGVEFIGAGGVKVAAETAAAFAAAEFEGSGGTPDDVGVSPPITFGNQSCRAAVAKGFRGDNNRDFGGNQICGDPFSFPSSWSF